MFINTIENIKKRIFFKYIGKIYIFSKKDFELFFINTIKNIIDTYDIKYFPRKIIVKFESKRNCNTSLGGTWVLLEEKEKSYLLFQNPMIDTKY